MSPLWPKWTKRLRRSEDQELVEVRSSPGIKSRQQAIPLVCRQTALTRFVHPDHLQSIAEIRRIQHDLDFEFYDDRQVENYMAEHWDSEPIFDVFKRAQIGQIRADIFRYCVTFESGGYYLDLSKGCYSPLSSMHSPEAGGIIAFERNQEVIFPKVETATKTSNPFNVVLQWAFGFRPEHPFLRLVIDRIVEIEPFFRGVSFENPKQAVLSLTGPGVFTDSYRKFLEQSKNPDITEAGIDFHGSGVFRIPGSIKSINKNHHYSQLSDQVIISARV